MLCNVVNVVGVVDVVVFINGVVVIVVIVGYLLFVFLMMMKFSVAVILFGVFVANNPILALSVADVVAFVAVSPSERRIFQWIPCIPQPTPSIHTAPTQECGDNSIKQRQQEEGSRTSTHLLILNIA